MRIWDGMGKRSGGDMVAGNVVDGAFSDRVLAFGGGPPASTEHRE